MRVSHCVFLETTQMYELLKRAPPDGSSQQEAVKKCLCFS